MSDARQQAGSKGEPAGWVGSLRFRLAVSVAGIVVVGIAGSLAVGYVLEYRTRQRGLLASLMEQAHSLEVARERIASPHDYAAYVDAFCARMNAEISPGHHILLVGPSGRVLASSQQHSGPEVERALLAAGTGQDVINLGDRRLAQARLRAGDGSTLIVAQYLDHMEGLLGREMLTRGISTALIGGLILLLVVSAMRAWVLGPIDRLKAAGRQWSRRNFAERAEPSGPKDIRSLAAAFNQMATELEGHESRRLAEMARARQIQEGLLPIHVPAVAGLEEIVARYEPAEDVAGDLYDIIPLPDGRTAILVLDVCGHGVSAALLTGVAKMALHRRLAGGDDLPAVIAKVDQDLARCLAEGQFVTLCIGLWNPAERTWTYCAAGHAGGALQSGDRIEHLPSTGPLLGIFEQASWSQHAVSLQPGQRLWLYTDGLVEAGIPGEMFGLEGVERILRQTADRTLDEQATALVEQAASRQRPEAEDDITIVGIACRAENGSADEGTPTGPAEPRERANAPT